MPNRLLRDWTGSEKVNILSVHAERFFTRLIMKADDYGCFYADARLLKANLFPLLLDEVREADISRWMDDCQKAGLIVLYEFANKRYLQICGFGQRLRQKVIRFPLPTNDSNMSATCQHGDSSPPHEEEVEVEGKRKNARARVENNQFRQPVVPTKNEVLECFVQNGGTAEMANSFYERSQATDWYFRGSPITNFRSLVNSFVTNWKRNLNGKHPEKSSAAPLKRAENV